MVGLDRLFDGFESVDLLINGWIDKHKHHSAILNKNPSLKTQTQISKDTDQKERALNRKIKKTKREREREPKRVVVMCVVCVASSVAPMVIFLKWVCWDMRGFGLV